MSDKKDAVGDRMKKYEGTPRLSLLTRTPVIVRVDGRAFHTYTRGMKRPFDSVLQNAMVDAAIAVAKEMSGFKLGYTQSDEASFLLGDWDTIETQPWFDNDQQKLASLCASLMTAYFNLTMDLFGPSIRNAVPVFDGRAFNLPMGPEVVNYFLWRAKDWERNSLSMVARSHFSAKQLHGKKKADMHEMLHQKGVNWTKDFDAKSRNGTFFYRTVADKKEVMIKASPSPSYGSLLDLI